MNMKILTPELHNKLRMLNDKLARIELMIVDKAIKIDKMLQDELMNKKDNIQSYSLDVYFHFYTYYESGDPIATWSESMKKVSMGKYSFLTDRNSHNDLHRLDHPIRDDYHCWLFHSLYDHIHLSWKKIAAITHVVWDIRPEYSYGMDLESI
jgi:hypothetical protein